MSLETRPYLLHALSPLHAGTGQSVGVIDLPIARLRATNIPFVPGSSLKGVLRELHRSLPPAEREALFGPLRKVSGQEGDEALEHAGALVVGDARLVALPVRSFFGTFALVSSPLLLNLARRDLAGLERLPGPLERRAGPAAWVGPGNVTVPAGHRTIFLEDLDLDAREEDPAVEAWARFLARALPQEEEELVRERFVVVDDETMDFLLETATQVDTRVRINPETGTVAEGALWKEESLPAETLLVGVLAAGPSLRRRTSLSPSEVLERALRGAATLQLGGKATVGRGRCRLAVWPGAGKEARP